MGSLLVKSENTLRLLVVASQPQVRQGLIAVLSLAGQATRPVLEVAGEAESGRAALQQVKALHPDVVLIDLEMPALDGYATTRCLKLMHPALRFVALTAYDSPEARRKADWAGFDAFLVKGAPLKDLITAILPDSAQIDPSTCNPQIRSNGVVR